MAESDTNFVFTGVIANGLIIVAELGTAAAGERVCLKTQYNWHI